MANPENIEEHKFKPGQSGNPKGRPPKLISHILNDLKAAGYKRVSATTIIDTYETLLNLDEKKLKDISDDKESPMFMRTIIKAMLDKRGAEMLERMLDRAHGRAKQVSDVQMEVSTGLPDASKFTFDELMKIANGSTGESKEMG